MADFADKLAAMIAAARPPQAPGGRGPVMAHGGGGMGIQGSNRVNVDVSNQDIRGDVDLGGILKWFGMEPKTPSLYRDIGAKAHQEFLSQTQQQRDQYLSDPVTQQLLKKIQGSGYPGVITDPNGRLTFTGQASDLVPEAMRGGLQATGGKLYQEGIPAGIYGSQARASWDVFRPKTGEEMMGADVVKRIGESRATLLDAEAEKQRVEAKSIPGITQARINASDAEAGLHRAQAGNIQLTAPAQRKLYEQQAEYYGRMPAERTEKEDPESRAIREHLNQIGSSWNSTVKGHEATLSDLLKGGTVQNRRHAINNLGSSAVSHVQQTLALTGQPIRGIGPASYYLSQVAGELSQQPMTTTSWGGVKSIDPDEDLQTRKLLNTTEALLGSFGNEAPTFITEQSLRNVETLSQRLNPTPEGIKQLATLLLFYDSQGLKAPSTATAISKSLNLLPPAQQTIVEKVLRRQGVGVR